MKEEKLCTNVPGHLWLMPKLELALTEDLLKHIQVSVILKSLSGPSPRLHFDQFKQRQDTASRAF